MSDMGGATGPYEFDHRGLRIPRGDLSLAEGNGRMLAEMAVRAAGGYARCSDHYFVGEVWPIYSGGWSMGTGCTGCHRPDCTWPPYRHQVEKYLGYNPWKIKELAPEAFGATGTSPTTGASGTPPDDGLKSSTY